MHDDPPAPSSPPQPVPPAPRNPLRSPVIVLWASNVFTLAAVVYLLIIDCHFGAFALFSVNLMTFLIYLTIRPQMDAVIRSQSAAMNAASLAFGVALTVGLTALFQVGWDLAAILALALMVISFLPAAYGLLTGAITPEKPE